MAKLAVVLIKDAKVDSRQVGSNTFQSQKGVLVLGEDEAMSIEISLRRDREPYPVGRYLVGAGSFDRDQYHRPMISRTGLELVPVEEAVASLRPAVSPAKA